jgi:hypothetical protein
MFKFRVIPLILCVSVMSCTDDNDDSTVIEENRLSGTSWVSDCTVDDSVLYDNKYFIKKLMFNESNAITEYIIFETSSCINSLSRDYLDAPYTLGDIYETASNNKVQDINFTTSVNGEVTGEILDIYKIENNYLYLGVERGSNLRPEAIDFNFRYEKQ